MAQLKEVSLDYSQPLAALVRAATAAAHDTIEHTQGAGWLRRGELDKEEYVRFLMMLFHVYSTLETALENYNAHPVLAPTFNPALLARAPRLSSDIAFLLDVPETTWREHPIHKGLLASPPAPLTAYVSRIKHLSEDASDPSPLLAHSYVRYLGDLSGGQIMRRRIVKVYDLEDDGRGTEFYDFKQLGSDKSAGIGDMNKIKDWFRAGMNEGSGEDASRKQAITEEAVKVFRLNEGLFTVLKAPSGPASSTPAAPPLGDPSPPPTPPSKTESFEVYNASEPEEKTYPLASILSVVLAVGIAHFALVVGGFTGSAGYEKLGAAQAWVERLFS